MKKGGTTTIIFKIESYEPDPQQYKPGKPHLAPEALYVSVDVPDKYFISVPGLPKGAKCLTLAGFQKLTKILIGVERF